MQTITATYQIVTPMFIGDVEQKASGITLLGDVVLHDNKQGNQP